MIREVINELKKYTLGRKNTEKVEISVLQLNRIIKALDQDYCEDCISRQAVNTLIDELARAISDERCCISRGRSTATIMRDIYHLPSANPQPKTGHCNSCKWYDEDGIYNPNCENCCRNYKDNYCGAKMVGLQENEVQK